MSDALDTLDDGDLVALYLAGRQAAFAVLMRRHRHALYRLIVARTRDGDAALDLLQETFVAAHGALTRFDRDRSLRAWLSRIALNKCRDRARRLRVRGWLVRVMPIEAGEGVIDPGVDVEGGAIDRERLAETLAAIARLPAALAEPLLLCTIEEMSQAEAAEALGISAKAVETRIRRARIALAADVQMLRP